MTHSFRALIVACLGGTVMPLMGSPAFAQAGRVASAGKASVVVQADGPIGAGTLVVAEVDGSIAPGVYTFKRGEQGSESPAEVFKRDGKTYLALSFDDGAKADSQVSLTLTGKSNPPHPSISAAQAQADQVPITVGGMPFVTYRSGDGPKPYYYPVIGPSGAPYTRAYPMDKVKGEDEDHPHQRSFYFTHGNVNGYDFWASDPLNKPNPKFGSTKETSRKILHNGQNAAVIETTDDWIGPDGKKVCEDRRVVSFFGLGKDRVIDFEITLKATDGPVTFGDTKEGMFGLRVASSMDVKSKTNSGGKIVNAEGLTDDKAWGQASPWVDYTGPVQGKTVGIAILNHPKSFRYPTTWHVRTYGLFAANPFGWHDFGQKKSGEHVLANGDSITFCYRVILHEGDTTSAQVPAAFASYAKPPKVQVSAKN